MKRTTQKRVVVLGAVSLALGVSSIGAWADTSTVPVSVAVVNGSRTLTVTDPTGAAISGTNGLPLGAGHGGGFLVNVADLKYSNVGYQVSATMTDLFPYSGSTYDLNATPIHSNRISVDYPGNLRDLANVKGVVAPALHLVGSVNLAGLGLPLGLSAIDTTADGTADEIQSLVNTVTDATYDATKLPISLQTGSTGAFTNPAGLPGQSGSFTPTSITLMSGDPGNPVNWLLTKLQTAYDGLTAQQLVDAGVIDQNAVLSAVAADLGVTPDAFTNADVTAILSNVTGTVTGLVNGLLGQTGSYSTLPALSINLPANAATGLYRGEMTVTLMDK